MPQILSSTFTGALSASQALSWNGDVFLRRDAANTLGLRNGANAQTFNIYNTFTDASNYERLTLGYDSGNNAFLISGNMAGTGTHRNLELSGGGNVLGLGMTANGNVNWTINAGHFLAGTDNASDIGASGANRPRNLFLSGGITSGATTLHTTSVALTNGAAANTATLTNAPAAGNPTKWVPINDNGTTRYIPCW